MNTDSGNSRIILDERFSELDKYLPDENVVIITDEIVFEHYKDGFPPFPVIPIGTGEKIKNLETIHTIYERLVNENVDRSTFILGIGGGVVCDIAGFVASTFLRGLKFGYVSTTLLSQVDASLGGKTGVNYQGFKNIIGTIRQPSFVFCDPEMLNTLPDREFYSGFAEIIKHAIIQSKDLFSRIEENIDKVKERNQEVILSFIVESIEIKASIVEQDVNEKGHRRVLNFGHTFGHAIEKVHNLKHGEAVGLGMIMASTYSVNKGILDHNTADRFRQVLERLGITRQINLDKEKIWEAIQVDKKIDRDKIYFVMVKAIGEGFVKEINLRELKSFLDQFVF